jgi:hypothetical protein
MTPELDEALVSAYSILSLLHHRGLRDTEWNRADVAKAVDKLRPWAEEAGDRIMARRERER